ncbi:hypothetical protein LT330_003806 [Penicillium expansum]|nr:hypothetical protein LT330_003806 [Penicillium expansum]
MVSNPNSNFDLCNHLIVVCCHAIYIGGSRLGASEDEWLIEPFQKGETPTFIDHVKAGLKALAEDSHGLLVFSGGPTKKPRTELSEGQSYLLMYSNIQNLARDNNYFQDMSTISTIDPSRIIAETNATDSYQNLLFSLIRFQVYTGVYPQRVTIVTHEFKRARFMQCHFPAVGLVPVSPEQEDYTQKVVVIGINPPEEITPSETLTRGEAMNGIGLWREDLYGVNPDLVGKRVVPEAREFALVLY